MNQIRRNYRDGILDEFTKRAVKIVDKLYSIKYYLIGEYHTKEEIYGIDLINEILYDENCKNICKLCIDIICKDQYCFFGGYSEKNKFVNAMVFIQYVMDKYYENLIKQKLQEQKEQLLEEIYAPGGIGYQAAKERFQTRQ